MALDSAETSEATFQITRRHNLYYLNPHLHRFGILSLTKLLNQDGWSEDVSANVETLVGYKSITYLLHGAESFLRSELVCS